MRTVLRSKALLFMTFGLLVAFAGIAVADNLQDEITTSQGKKSIATGDANAWTNDYFVQGTGSTVTATGTSCNVNAANPVTFSLTVPGGVTASTTSLTFTGCGAANSQPVTFKSNTPDVYNIQASYVSGGIGSPASGEFNLNNADLELTVVAAPTVTATSPANNATGVAVGSNVTATFDQGMNATTINADTFKLVKDGDPTNTPIPATFSYDATSRVATLNPHGTSATNLLPGTKYNVVVVSGGVKTPVQTQSGGVEVAGGYTLEQDKTWSFTTFNPNTAPTVPGAPTTTSNPNQGTFGLTWPASSDNESNPITYTLQHKDANDAAFSNVATGISGNSYAFTGASPEVEGTWTYQVKASDGSLESAYSTASDPIKVDKSGPNPPNATPSKTAEDTSGGWYKDSVTINYSAAGDPNLLDGSPGSGVASVSNSQAFSTSGSSHNYSGTATDNAGNVSTATTGTVKVDATNPTVGITGCPTGVVGFGSTQNVTVSASDAHSGLVSDPSGQVALDTSQRGPQQLLIQVSDKVGHTAQATCDYTVNTAPSDPGAPTLAGSSPNQGAFTLNWTASTDADNNLDHYVLQHKDTNDADFSDVANVNSSSHSYTFGGSNANEAEGTWTYRVKAVDAFEDSGYATSTANLVKVDQSAPSQPNANFSKSAEDTVGGWYKDSVTVSYNGSTDPALLDTSAGSGVASYTAAQAFSTSGSSHNYSGTATDNAGNVSTATTGTVKVDATNPTVGITGCPTSTVLRNSTQNVTVSASDAHSGLVSDPSGTVALDTSSVGEHTKTIQVSDKVGHTAQATCTYSVNFTFVGFTSPVDNPTVLNVAKAGSAIPLKWQLVDANGPVTNLSSVDLSVATLACAGLGTSDDLEVYASGSSGLQNLGGGYYQFNWKSQSSYFNSCKTLTLNLGEKDASGNPLVHKALFQFKK